MCEQHLHLRNKKRYAYVRLGISPIGWSNDDLPELGSGTLLETCLAEAREEAQHLLRREQGKSILLIEAPILGYLAFYLLAALWQFRRTAPPA